MDALVFGVPGASQARRHATNLSLLYEIFGNSSRGLDALDTALDELLDCRFQIRSESTVARGYVITVRNRRKLTYGISPAFRQAVLGLGRGFASVKVELP